MRIMGTMKTSVYDILRSCTPGVHYGAPDYGSRYNSSLYGCLHTSVYHRCGLNLGKKSTLPCCTCFLCSTPHGSESNVKLVSELRQFPDCFMHWLGTKIKPRQDPDCSECYFFRYSDATPMIASQTLASTPWTTRAPSHLGHCQWRVVGTNVTFTFKECDLLFTVTCFAHEVRTKSKCPVSPHGAHFRNEQCAECELLVYCSPRNVPGQGIAIVITFSCK